MFRNISLLVMAHYGLLFFTGHCYLIAIGLSLNFVVAVPQLRVDPRENNNIHVTDNVGSWQMWEMSFSFPTMANWLWPMWEMKSSFLISHNGRSTVYCGKYERRKWQNRENLRGKRKTSREGPRFHLTRPRKGTHLDDPRFRWSHCFLDLPLNCRGYHFHFPLESYFLTN